MKIAVVNNFYPPRVGGSAHLADSLAKAYAAAQHDVMVITTDFGDAPARERDRGVDIVRFPAWSFPRLGTAIDFDISFAGGPRNLRRLFRLLDSFEPDVIHIHGQFLDLSWLASFYARRRHIPVLLSVHTRLESTIRGYSLAFGVLDNLLVRPIIALGRPMFVVMDKLMASYIRTRYRVGSDRTVAIPVGVSVSAQPQPEGTRARIRSALGIADRPMILSLGHVIPLRDRLALVEALPRIIARVPDAAVVVVGDVNYGAFLDRADALGVRDHIICTGAVARDEVAAYLAAADVETHDLQGLGLGTASLEAMVAGVPVVAAVDSDNFPGIELCSGDNITLTPLGDPESLAVAICGLLDNRALAHSIGERQRTLVLDHFSMDAVASAYLAELRQLSESDGD